MRYCFALDLVEDKRLITEYENWHRNIWPEIVYSIQDSGIKAMEIYRVFNRLFMIMETNGDFTFERKAAMDSGNARVQEWETLMWVFQKPLPGAKPGEKWIMMDKIFDLNQ